MYVVSLVWKSNDIEFRFCLAFCIGVFGEVVFLKLKTIIVLHLGYCIVDCSFLSFFVFFRYCSTCISLLSKYRK
jgi:hypothetical protein